MEYKNCRHGNSLLHHGYILRLLALKGNVQYILKTKIQSWRNLEQISKATQSTKSQDCNTII